MADTPVKLPLIGNPTNRAGDIEKDQRFVNCYPEILTNPAVEGQKVTLLKRDGTSPIVLPSGGPGEGRGVHSWNGYIYAVIENKLYSIDSVGAVVDLKTLTTSTGLVGMTEYTATNDYLVLLDGVKGYYISTTNVVTEITDVEFPTPHLPYPVFMDGYLLVQKTSGEIFNCDVGDITSWAASSYIVPESYPDGAVALARQNNMVVALGVNSVEFFYDAANPSPGSPLGRNLQAIIQYGCASGATVAQEEGLVVFVAVSSTGEKFVVSIEGTKDTVISTEPINRLLRLEESNIVDSWGYLCRQKGHLFYVLNLPEQGRTLVYDINLKYWHEWEWFDGVVDSMFPMIDSIEYEDTTYYLHQADGTVYKASPSVYEDNQNEMRVIIQTSRYDGGTGKVKFMSRLEVLGDWQDTTSNLSIYWSDDDYKTWTTPRTVDLSSRAYLYRCGSFRRRAFKLYHAANTPLRLESLEAIVTLGTH